MKAVHCPLNRGNSTFLWNVPNILMLRDCGKSVLWFLTLDLLQYVTRETAGYPSVDVIGLFHNGELPTLPSCIDLSICLKCEK